MPFKTGIIGAGLIAETHAKALNELDEAELTGFCDNGSGRAAQLAAKYNCKAWHDYKKMITSGDIDVVIIASPSGVHMEPALLAAEHGIHVLCEKPLEITRERTDRMIQAHKKSNTYLGGIFNFRFDGPVPFIKRAIEEGRFGAITYAGAFVPWWRNEEYYTGNWHGTQDLDGGGALMNQSIHMVDLLQYLMGPVHAVKSYTGTLAHKIETEDTAVAIFQFSNKALGMLHGTTAAYPGQPRRLEIMGTKGTVIMENTAIKTWEFATSHEDDRKIADYKPHDQTSGGAADPGDISFINHQKNIRSFLKAIKEGAKFEIDGEEARKAIDIVLSIYESGKSGQEWEKTF
ncbi:MAG: Gfo/Idh/MocA family protein [Bacteroidota bacterium]